MTNQKLLDMMSQEGYYQKNVVRITRLFLENDFVISKIHEGFIILKKEHSESIEFLKCFSSACEYIYRSMSDQELCIVITKPESVLFVD